MELGTRTCRPRPPMLTSNATRARGGRSSTPTITSAAGSSNGRSCGSNSPLLTCAERDVREIRKHAIDAERIELLVLELRIAVILGRERRWLATERVRVNAQPSGVRLLDQRRLQ